MREDLSWVGANILLVSALSLAACGQANEPAVRADRVAISGGEPVAPGAWPMVVWLDNGCTGVLLAENIVAFAAHCGANVDSVWLGDTLDISIDDAAGVARAAAGANIREVHTLGCTLHPDFELGTATDVAFCTLESAVIPRNEIIYPALGCGRARVDVGTSVTLVGFGRPSADDPPGIKRAVSAPVVSVSPSFQIGDDVHGTCAGDSGSPAFVRIDDGASVEWAVAGILSGGNAGEACGVGYYVDLSVALGWLETASGADFSPCFDARGAWAPSAECTRPTIDGEGFVTADSAEPDTACGPAYSGTDGNGCAFGAAHADLLTTWRSFVALVLAAAVRRKRRGRGFNRTERHMHLRSTT